MGISLANILVVDDHEIIREMLASALRSEGYSCYRAGSAEEAFGILNGHRIDLIISDIMMPGRSGVDLLRDIKKVDADIAVLMITGQADMDIAMECIHLGADDYIFKPFSIDRIYLTVKNLLEKRNLTIEMRNYQVSLEFKVLEQTELIHHTMKELHKTYDHTLTALVRALDAREKEVGSHSERVMNYTLLMASRMGINGKDLEQLAKGALLHDIGKIGISDSILLKPGALDSDEWLEMRRHPEVGHTILSEIGFLKGPAELILTHHERFDGAGFPCGLKGEQIPIGSRIFALVDTLDAMTSDRPYRKALPLKAVTAEVQRCKGSQFDPDIADLFLSINRTLWEECAGAKFN
jgi:putative nucleotidyltransferase with HDIG domain